MSYELTPEMIIPGRAVATVTETQGKPRIRLQDQSSTTHFYRLLAAVLLLPKPKREFKETHGHFLKRESYSMTAINVDVGAKTAKSVVLRPTEVLLQNADHLRVRVDVVDRMTRVFRIWDAAKKVPGPLAELVLKHKAAVNDAAGNHKAIEAAAEAVSAALHTNGDALPRVEHAFGLPAVVTPTRPRGAIGEKGAAEITAEDDKRTPMEARIDRVKQWRQQAVRGHQGKKFREDVRVVYDARCLFSGQRLPKTDVTETAGVDSAHILPWSTYDINSVRNGVCLNKLCHWGFDEGVVRLSFDKAVSAYVLDVPAQMVTAAKKAGFDLDFFKALAGPIPASRLPAEKGHWPKPDYLAELNKFMFNTSV
jgi:hypothetical protein